jgi:DNA (cytosine-5)-methyltransferase 1
MRFGSVCSGIEAASVAWHPLKWQAAWLSEIEPFPSAVLKHHYPDVPNLGDMTLLPSRIASGEVEAPDLFCGGTPCQAFSVAGLRKSLDDARGNLSLIFCEIANAIDTVRTGRGEPSCVVFWENVPGVLSTKDNAFGCFLAGLAGEDLPLLPPGGKWSNAGCVFGPQRAVAWRVLDAQYFGVAQRRRRVFVVASARDDFDPASVLFEFDGVRRDIAPSRETGQSIAPAITAGAPNGGPAHGARSGSAKEGLIVPVQPYEVGNCLTARMHKGINSTLDEGQTPVISFHPTQDPISSTDGSTHALGCGSSGGQASVGVAAEYYSHDYCQDRIYSADGISPALNCSQDHTIRTAMQVRRLTPVECERLQGFPDHYTAIPWRRKTASECPDGPRYKALGNSWAVPVVRWIGERIAASISPVVDSP